MDKKLTNRELQVLKCILKGYSNKEIAKELFISFYTAKAHVSAILYKMQVEDRVDLVLKLFDENVHEYIRNLDKYVSHQ